MRYRFSSIAVAALAVATIAAGPADAAQQGQQERCVPQGELFENVPWPQEMLAPEEIWPITDGDGQRVAVIGTGVSDTPYLAGQVATSADFVPRDESAARTEADCFGVGTGVAGIIAGKRVKNGGFSGIAPGAVILSAKVVGDQYPDGKQASGSVSPDTLANAISWAIERRATVIAVAAISEHSSSALRTAVQRALDNDIVVIGSMGEAKKDDPALTPPYPAAYQGVIRVGAIGKEGTVAGFSRDLPVDLVAPGVEVITTYPGGGLGTVSGTAFATGFVAATVALVRSYHPELGPSEVARRLLATASPAPQAAGNPKYGHGIVSPYHAVLDRTGEGEPVSLPSMTRPHIDDGERARQAAVSDGNTQAFVLTGTGLWLAALVIVLMSFGRRGSRRRWRSGLAQEPQNLREAERPDPPVELFADRHRDTDR